MRLASSLRIAGRVIAMSAAGAIIFSAAAYVAYAAHPILQIEFDDDRQRPLPLFRGVFPSERFGDGLTAAWTSNTGSITFDGLDRRVPWTVSIRLRAGRPPGMPLPRVAFTVDGLVGHDFVARNQFTDVVMEAPLRPTNRGLVVGWTIDPSFRPRRGDRRVLGVLVDRVSVVPSERPAPPSNWTMRSALAGALLGLAFGILPLASWFALGLLTFAAIVAGGVGAIDVAPYVDHAAVLVWCAGASAVASVAIVAIAMVTRQAVAAPAAVALAITSVALLVKSELVFHPTWLTGDSVFHLNRLGRVEAGRLFFTSEAPGGRFPYPVALYVVVSWLRGTAVESLALLRAVPLVTDSLAGLALWGLAARGLGSVTVATAGLVFYHLTPAVFQIQAIAYLTNAFSQSVMVIALAAAVTVPIVRLVSPQLAVFVFATFVAFVSHLGTFLLLSAALGAASALALMFGDRPARRWALAVAGGTIAAVALSVWLYYGHFASDFAETAKRLTALPTAVASADSLPQEIPLQRAEAHQTEWVPGWPALQRRLRAAPGYVAKYLTWPLVLLAAAGTAELIRQRARHPAAMVLYAWTIACLVFFVLGQITPLDIRYYLGVAPAFAVLAGVAVERHWRTGGWPRLVVALLSVWVAAAGVIYWFRWFAPLPPR